jgi:hypothetical protein
MKKTIVFSLLLCLLTTFTFAQHYYKDIISNKQLLKDMAAYRENKIRTITIKSFEDDRSPSEGFFCQKKLSKDYKKTELFTRSNISASSLFTSAFDEEGYLLSTHDSSDISVTTNKYMYDPKKRISSIQSSVRSRDDDFTNEIYEEHLYFYNDKDQPEKMIRVKNHSDSIVIAFAMDENGNVGIEKDTRSGTKFYYYYDAKNRLSDIVQANDSKIRPYPDYIFDYNSQGLLMQMTSTEEGSKNYYYVWKYTYDNGLRIREKCFSKEKRLMGSIEYEYK